MPTDETVAVTHDLSNNHTDHLAAVLRAFAGMVPFAGSMLSEIVTVSIPSQKLDRVVDFAKRLDARLARLENENVLFEMQSSEFCDLFEDAATQASRALSPDRRDYLAALLSRGASSWSTEHARQKKLLRLLDNLTDDEVVVLRFHAVRGSSPERTALRDRHPKLLRPASREIAAERSEKDRRALQDSYRRNLESLGLLDTHGTMGGGSGEYRISSLGKLMIRYIVDEE